MTALAAEPRFLYADYENSGRAELLADLNKYIAEMDLRMPEQFATKPPYPVEVRRTPVEGVQDSAAGGRYTSPAIDGSKPGNYSINLADITANPKFDLKTLTYHEANPGHHWQIALGSGPGAIAVAASDHTFTMPTPKAGVYTLSWWLSDGHVAKAIHKAISAG